MVAGVLPPVVGGGVSLSEESAAPPLLMVMDKPGWVNMPVVCCFDTGKKKLHSRGRGTVVYNMREL